MIFRIFGINQNVINEDHYEFVKFMHEDRVHEIHEVCWVRPNDMTRYSKSPYLVEKAIFGMLLGLILI
jgi:hypothetical protein